MRLPAIRTLCLSLLVGLLAGALGGCGAKKIDRAVVEKAIEISIAQQQHVIAIVSCPKDVESQRGKVFYCGATLGSGRQLPITVSVKDDQGNVHYSGFNGFVNGRPAGS
jgi:hypothetical protein